MSEIELNFKVDSRMVLSKNLITSPASNPKFKSKLIQELNKFENKLVIGLFCSSPFRLMCYHLLLGIILAFTGIGILLGLIGIGILLTYPRVYYGILMSLVRKCGDEVCKSLNLKQAEVEVQFRLDGKTLKIKSLCASVSCRIQFVVLMKVQSPDSQISVVNPSNSPAYLLPRKNSAGVLHLGTPRQNHYQLLGMRSPFEFHSVSAETQERMRRSSNMEILESSYATKLKTSLRKSDEKKPSTNLLMLGFNRSLPANHGDIEPISTLRHYETTLGCFKVNKQPPSLIVHKNALPYRPTPPPNNGDIEPLNV